MPRLIGQGDTLFKYKNGGSSAGGAAPSYGTLTTINNITHVNIVDEAVVDSTNVFDRARKKYRVVRGKTTIKIDMNVDSAQGYQFCTLSGGVYTSSISLYLKLYVQENAGTATTRIFEGIISHWENGITDGFQTESIVLTCDIEPY